MGWSVLPKSLEAIKKIKSRAAVATQRNLSRVQKWADRNLVKSSRGKCKSYSAVLGTLALK